MEKRVVSIEEKLLEQVEKKKKKKKNKRILRFVLIICSLCLVVFYLLSDMSKVKSLTVQNNSLYSDEQILEKTGLSYESSYILTVRWFVNWKLEKDPLIQKASLKKDLQGGFTIYIEEEKVIGYLKEQPTMLLIEGEGLYEVSDVHAKNMARIGDFNEEQLAKLNEAFKEVEAGALNRVSEILPYSESYDSDMVMFVMNDGNRVKTSYGGIYLLNNYRRILPQLEGTHVCLFMDELSGSIIKQSGECTASSSKTDENVE